MLQPFINILFGIANSGNFWKNANVLESAINAGQDEYFKALYGNRGRNSIDLPINTINFQQTLTSNTDLMDFYKVWSKSYTDAVGVIKYDGTDEIKEINMLECRYVPDGELVSVPILNDGQFADRSGVSLVVPINEADPIARMRGLWEIEVVPKVIEAQLRYLKFPDRAKLSLTGAFLSGGVPQVDEDASNGLEWGKRHYTEIAKRVLGILGISYQSKAMLQTPQIING